MVSQPVATRVAQTICRSTPSVVLYRAMSIEVITLVYHVVSAETLPHVRHLYAYKTPSEFVMDLNYLQANHHILSFEECENGHDRRRRGRPAILLTFDDGMSECYDVVRPILLQRGIPCTFFVTTSFIDNQRMFYRHKVSLCVERIGRAGAVARGTRQLLACVNRRCGCRVYSAAEFTEWITRLGHADEDTIDVVCDILEVAPREFLRRRKPYLTTEQLEQLAVDGFTLGGHGRQHAQLAELGDPALIEEEIVESCECVRRIARSDRVPFAFPFTGRRVSRALLTDIVSRYPAVSLLFDTNGLAADAPIVMNRIGADRPAEGGTASSTLPNLLRRVVEDEGVGRAAATMRRLLM